MLSDLVAATLQMKNFDESWEEQLSAHKQVREDYCMDLGGHFWPEEWIAGLAMGEKVTTFLGVELRLMRTCGLCQRSETYERRCAAVDGSDILWALTTESRVNFYGYLMYRVSMTHTGSMTAQTFRAACDRTPYDPTRDPTEAGEDPFPVEDQRRDYSLWLGDGTET